MIRLAAIDHVVFRVADLDASLRFYTGALGATLVGRNPALWRRTWVDCFVASLLAMTGTGRI